MVVRCLLQTFCEVFRPSDVSAAVSARRAVVMKCFFSCETRDSKYVLAKCAVSLGTHTSEMFLLPLGQCYKGFGNLTSLGVIDRF